MAEKTLLNIDEVSEMTSISPLTLKKMVKAGEFPTPAINKRQMKRWLTEDVEKWLKSISTMK